MKLSTCKPEIIQRYLALGYWTHEMMCDQWDRCARINPDKVGLVDSNTRLTFAQVKQWTDRVALGFHDLGITRDDVLAAQYPNSADAFMTWLVGEKSGVAVARCQSVLRYKEMLHILRKIKAVGIIIPRVYRDFDYYGMIQAIRPELPELKHTFVLGDDVPPGTISLSELARTPLEDRYPQDFFIKNKVRPGEAAYLGVTSGTTGLPKIVARPAFGVTPDFQQAQRWKLNTDDVIACLAPFYGGGANPPARAAAVVGARLVLMEKFDAEKALQLIQREHVTFACTVPAQIAMMVRHPDFGKYDLSSLRIIYYAAATCPYSLIQEVEERIGCRVLSLYGITEGGIISTACYDDSPSVRALSVGKLFYGVDITLLGENGAAVQLGEVGELCVRGGLTSCRFRDDVDGGGSMPDSYGEGWVRSGDLVKTDEEGNLYIVGRSKDVIIRGGQNIYPREVEDILVTHSKVLNAAVVAMPDPVMGEKSCAFVIPRSADSLLTFDEMVAFLKKERMAAHKLPERLEIVSEFPMSGDGQKVLKRELTERVTAKLKAEEEIQ